MSLNSYPELLASSCKHLSDRWVVLCYNQTVREVNRDEFLGAILKLDMLKIPLPKLN